MEVGTAVIGDEPGEEALVEGRSVLGWQAIGFS